MASEDCELLATNRRNLIKKFLFLNCCLRNNILNRTRLYGIFAEKYHLLHHAHCVIITRLVHGRQILMLCTQQAIAEERGRKGINFYIFLVSKISLCNTTIDPKLFINRNEEKSELATPLVRQFWVR